jgi:hypothetical protein
MYGQMSDPEQCKGRAPETRGFIGFCAETACWCTSGGMFTRRYIDVDWPALGQPPLPADGLHEQGWARCSP